MPRFDGTTTADTLNGSYAGDSMFGLGGDDILNGGFAKDYLYGDRDQPNSPSPSIGGADTIRGGYGND
ncbi:MAG TPA: RTX toxin, partial [Allosphingosinicella sp.]|nr:RTX toxin [Allosphingosinicella sp.]